MNQRMGPDPPDLQGSSFGEVPRRVRDAAVAAFDEQELGVPVLDLEADALVPLPGTGSWMRRLRFAGHGRVVDVDVSETRSLAVNVRLSPAEPAIMEVRTAGAPGQVETRHRGTGLFMQALPGLTSILIRWVDDERHAVRTAWVRL